MTIKLLSPSDSLLRWHLEVDADWHQTQRITVTRTITKGIRAGITESITRRGKRNVVDGAKATGEILLKLYRKRVERVLHSSLLSDTICTDTGITLPSMSVNARMLMQKRSLTERTMRNHLAQLSKIGFIIKKKWHGRKCSFELWINPDFVIKKVEDVVESLQNTDKHDISLCNAPSNIGKKFPHIKLLEPLDLSEVQKDQTLVDIGLCGNVQSVVFSERPSQEAEVCNLDVEGHKEETTSTRGGGTLKPDTHIYVNNGVVTSATQARNDSYVTSAWGYAKALLYAEYKFSPHEEGLAMQAIRQGVYGNFIDESLDFDCYHKGVLRRIELVERYFSKHNGRYYAAMPWAVIVKGKGYFDAENEKGFKGTLVWLEANKKAEIDARIKRKIKHAIGELKLRRKLDYGGTVTRHVAPHIEASSLGQLYRHHEKYFLQLGSTRALDLYNVDALALLHNFRKLHKRRV